MQRQFFCSQFKGKFPPRLHVQQGRCFVLGSFFCTTLVQTTESLPSIDEERQAKNNYNKSNSKSNTYGSTCLYTTRTEYSTNWQHLQKDLRSTEAETSLPKLKGNDVSLSSVLLAHLEGSKLEISYPKRKGKDRKGNGRHSMNLLRNG